MNSWDETLTAQKYDEYANKYSQYIDTSRHLIQMTEIASDMTVIDLACGTGVTSEQLIQLANPAKIYAVDQSQAMLDRAKVRLKDRGNVTFLKCNAEDIDQTIGEKVDLVICNSAFWQMNMDLTLLTIRKVLKSSGEFAFNLPSQYFSFADIKTSTGPSLRELMRKVAQEAGFNLAESGIRKLDKDFVEDLIVRNGFQIKKTQVISEPPRTIQESYDFLRIPVMTTRILPGMTYKQRMEVLDKAFELVDKSQIMWGKWIYYVASPSDTSLK